MKSKKKNKKIGQKGFIYYNYVVILIILVAAVVLVYNYNTIIQTPVENQLKKFSSCSQIDDFVKSASEAGYYGVASFGASAMRTETVSAQTVSASQAKAAAEDYSTTNIQVQGVDEADIVKNDEKYIYSISGNDIFIVDAYPAEGMQVLSKIEFNENQNPTEIFINDNKLVVFSQDYGYDNYYIAETKIASVESMIMPPRYTTPRTNIFVYDISDKANPKLSRNLSVDGNYYDSRMIGDYVYAVIDNPIQYDNVTIPIITEAGVSPTRGCADVYYFDIPDYSYKFTTILAVNTQNDNQEPNSKVFLMGYTQNMFVSLNNIYVTYMKTISQTKVMERIIEAILPALPADVSNNIRNVMNSDLSGFEKTNEIGEIFNKYVNNLTDEQRIEFYKSLEERMRKVYEEIAKEMQRTIIHKISIKDGDINYIAQGDVPGNVLNQFSMGEYNNYFRIATTTSEFSRVSSASKNHLYVLDSELKVVGKVEDLASGETIYSARFLGNRAYLVTFKKIDPLFVIDLSEPTNPKVLGYLKVTGYSDYLHPYDENHIIGIGKETAEPTEEEIMGRDFAWYQGVKISLFDVSDVANPKELSKFEIGDRGTDSEALRDHKAFLFDKNKNLLVIPITLAEIDASKYTGEVPSWAYGEQKWQGAYVFDITLENGIRFKGRITHIENLTKNEYGRYDLPYEYHVRRSLYTDNILYTISQKVIKANDITTIEEIKKVELG